ncbi:uncharacterized protein LOC103524557 [Diaphorina citri]|uniref:Uncharacterized protein LOC103524557 n=1 Tax=Diaphorina citri TaxID=121845 RepID=A0A3Q0IN59_DIACI|nr:uncharacterized protein LOC103524557 [Diaphorina citri]
MGPRCDEPRISELVRPGKADSPESGRAVSIAGMLLALVLVSAILAIWLYYRKRVKDLKTEIVENQTVHYNRNVSPDPTHFENPAYSFSPSPGYAPDGACALPGSYPNNMINNFNQPRTKLNNLERERSLDCDSDSYRSE